LQRLHHLHFGVAGGDGRHRIHHRFGMVVVQCADDEHGRLFVGVDDDLFLLISATVAPAGSRYCASIA
jgi:hypothetical protein